MEQNNECCAVSEKSLFKNSTITQIHKVLSLDET